MQNALPNMRRRIIAAAWIVGATVPLLLVTAFLVGCCALPFHGVMHKVMPLCAMATQVIAGHGHEAQPQTPAREKQDPVKQITTVVPQSFRLAIAMSSQRTVAPTAATAYRSFISLGAVRCDRDVGLHVVDATFLI